MHPLAYVGIGIAGVVVLAFLYGALVWAPKQRRINRRWLLKLMTQGEDHLAYVVFANKALYERNTGEESYSYAQVVYCTDPGVPNLRDELVGIGERLKAFELENPDDVEERLIASVLKTEVPLMRSVKLPPRIAGRLTAYTYSVLVHWDSFVENRLADPFWRIKVLPGEKECHIYLVPEPGSLSEERCRMKLEVARRENPDL
jgi:hypothetical protein